MIMKIMDGLENRPPVAEGLVDVSLLLFSAGWCGLGYVLIQSDQWDLCV